MKPRLSFSIALMLVVSLVSAGAALALTRGSSVGVTLNEFNVIPAKQSAPKGKVTFTVRTPI